MNKRRRSGDGIDVIQPTKQICLNNEGSEKPAMEFPNDQNATVPMEFGENEQQQIVRSKSNEMQGAGMKASGKKETPSSGGELKKGRRRTSGRWDFHGGTMRDPLNLKSVQPEKPADDGAISEEPKKAEENKSKRPKRDDSFNAKKTNQQQIGEEIMDEKGEGKKQQRKISASELSTTATLKSFILESEGQQKAEHRKKMNERFRYGNFNNYHLKKAFQRFAPVHHHFYNRQHHPPPPQQQFAYDDPRVDIFCPDWFVDKTVLDVGCNAGRFAISLARRFQPRRVIGIDLDQHLVGAARKNIHIFVEQNAKFRPNFPAYFAAATSGPLPSTSASISPPRPFPDNIWFFCENYVLKSDEELAKVNEEFDIIFALATTKWVHLNWGDAGMRRFFQRAFRQLRTGGRFVVETAPYREYKKHCSKKGNDRPPEEVLTNFAGIRFYPEEFTDFLLGEQVGFSHHEELSTQHTKHLGISGRLQVFYKGKFMLTSGQQQQDGTPGEEGEEEQQQPNSTSAPQLLIPSPPMMELLDSPQMLLPSPLADDEFPNNQNQQQQPMAD